MNWEKLFCFLPVMISVGRFSDFGTFVGSAISHLAPSELSWEAVGRILVGWMMDPLLWSVSL